MSATQLRRESAATQRGATTRAKNGDWNRAKQRALDWARWKLGTQGVTIPPSAEMRLEQGSVYVETVVITPAKEVWVKSRERRSYGGHWREVEPARREVTTHTVIELPEWAEPVANADDWHAAHQAHAQEAA